MDLGLNYGTFRWLKRGPRRKRTLVHLASLNHATRPTDIAKALGLPLCRTSDTLRELRTAQLVRVLNSHARFDRHYVITRRGLRLVRRLQQTYLRRP